MKSAAWPQPRDLYCWSVAFGGVQAAPEAFYAHKIGSSLMLLVHCRLLLLLLLLPGVGKYP